MRRWSLLVLLVAWVNCALAGELGLVVSNAWVRAGPPVSKMMAAYLRIENTSQSQRTLHGASSAAFNSIELHATVIKSGMASMGQVSELNIDPGQHAALQAGGTHLMLIGPVKPLKAGDWVEIELDFGAIGALSVQFPVRRVQE